MRDFISKLIFVSKVISFIFFNELDTRKSRNGPLRLSLISYIYIIHTRAGSKMFERGERKTRDSSLSRSCEA